MELDIGQNVLLDGPAKEIQLGHRGEKGRMIRNLEIDSLTAAKGIKEFLAVGFQLALVVPVDQELLAVQNIIRGVSLGVIGNKPINYSKTDFRGALEHGDNLGDVIHCCIETLKRIYDEFLLTVNLASAGLRVRVVANCRLRGDFHHVFVSLVYA